MCCECARAGRVLNENPARIALFCRVPDVFAACGSAEETPQKLNDPDKLRLQYKIAVLRHQQNLPELTLHEICVIRRRRGTGSDRGLVDDEHQIDSLY